MTSTSVGWMLLDRQGPDALTLDHDAFDIQSTANGTIHDTSKHAAAAKGAQAIATASGRRLCPSTPPQNLLRWRRGR